jgi:hypothetical protein
MIRLVVMLFVVTTLSIQNGYAQVGEIKSASSGKSSDSGSSGSSGGSFMVDFFFQFMLGNMIQWQRASLDQRHDIPGTVSLEVMLQTAIQPSSYYIVHPRIRGNWGIFSTDYRMNFIVEETFDGIEYLQTNEWQVLQLNVINTRDFGLRIGGGFLQERFNDQNYYPEVTGAIHVRPSGKKLSGLAEYRNADARAEVNGHLRYSIFNRSHVRGFVTAGAVFQRYYQAVNVWGLQGGVAFSVY